MTEQEKRTQRVCFTGHRPEKLYRREADIKADLAREICLAVAAGKTIFLTGMARGVDLWGAELVLELREKGEPVRLIAASPYPGFQKGWSRDWQERYDRVLAAADLVRYAGPHYHPGCFQRRNRWMVDHASLVIAVTTHAPSGTKNTTDYAESQGVPVVWLVG